jgi:hypothetical protein
VQVTSETKWQNPFGVHDDAGGGGELYESWKLYERFGFRGLFDDLLGIRFKSRLPRTGLCRGARVQCRGWPSDVADGVL